MPQKLSKRQKSEIRRLQGLAWERELGQALADLESDFSAWRSGEIDAFELSDRIHRFHDGRSRDLYKFYDDRNPFAVPSAIAKGVLSESEVSDELLALLAHSIKDFREGMDDE